MAAKMKTLTYQLSNLKFVEQGWTLRKPPDFEISSDEDSEDEEHILIPRNLSSSKIKVIKNWVIINIILYFILSIEIWTTINSKIL